MCSNTIFMIMRRGLVIIILALLCNVLLAGVTTYTFTSKDWKSKVDATMCDGKTDGWICDKEAYECSQGYTDASGRIYSRGVSVKTGTSGAGATSVVVFEDVRMIEINFCQNASKGKGSIFVQVGENEAYEIVINRPPKSQGQYNRDTTLLIAVPQSGKIRFWVNCTENSININTLTIHSSNGGSSPFTTDTYQLVTALEQLQDKDQIIIGVHRPDVMKIMGYYDESVSQNNIHAIAGKYSEDRIQVSANDEAIYTLHSTELNGARAFYIEDSIRYGGAYLVASGGQTKNRLALWDKLYDDKTYGNYGYWDITIASDGEATVKNLGNSAGKYLQYNASNHPTLFACYAELSQTPICIYRRVEALGDTMAIVTSMTNFGTVLLDGQLVTGSKGVQINANRLSEDITVWLKQGSVFCLSDSIVDRDGGYLNISYEVSAGGDYRDTLVLQSGAVRCEALVLLQAVAPMTIEQAIQSSDFEFVYLDSVVVTKKFDSYIFIRDTTGSMLIYDTGDGEGKRYGAGLKQGNVLRQVVGRFRNYYGVPEIAPSQAWSVEREIVDCQPELIPQLDSTLVCHYVRIEDAQITEDNLLSSEGISVVSIEDKFDMGMQTGSFVSVDAIVMMVWNQLQLWCVAQEYMSSDVQDVQCSQGAATKFIRDGQLYIRYAGEVYSLMGGRVVEPQE